MASHNTCITNFEFVVTFLNRIYPKLRAFQAAFSNFWRNRMSRLKRVSEEKPKIDKN